MRKSSTQIQPRGNNQRSRQGIGDSNNREAEGRQMANSVKRCRESKEMEKQLLELVIGYAWIIHAACLAI